MYSDAKRIARYYNINDIQLNETGGKTLSQSNAVGLEKAINLEQSGRYDEAIDTYLMLTSSDCGGLSQYDQVMERAVKLTITYRQPRLSDVINAVAQKLIDLKRHSSLGKILENIEAFPDAFEIYKAGGMWEDAARLVGYLEADEQAEFQKEYQQYLSQNQNVNGLMGIGQIDAALSVYAKNGDWDTCLQNAQKEGPQYVEKYTMMYAQELVNNQKFDDAITVLAKYSPSSNSTNIPAYISLCQSTVYAVPSYDVIKPSFFALRQMLFKVLRNSTTQSPGFVKLQNLTRAVHLLCQQSQCMKYGLTELAARASLSALRYCDVIPADFLFYKAGDIMEKQGNEDTALVLYNTFLDIVQVNKGESESIDYQKLEKTDIPKEMCLRKQLSVSDKIQSHINDWVIEKTMSDEGNPELPMIKCQKCGKQMFIANLSCPYCNAKYEFCSITGCPVNNPTRCTSCNCVANRADWGLYISKTKRCPCCDAPQTAGA